MALARPTFDQASELIIKWYYSMRVDFLEVDELEWELESRSITIDDSLSLTQKRKWLRDSLKLEKRSSMSCLVGILKGEVKNEIETCIQKFLELKEKWELIANDDDKNVLGARLSHVGARMVVILTSAKNSPNLHSKLQNMLVELVGILEQGLNDPPLNETVDELANPVENNTRVNQTNANLAECDLTVTTPPPRMTVLSQEDLDWIHSLQNRIVDLEFELQRRKGRDVGTQTSDEIAPLREPPRMTYYNPNHNFGSFPWTNPRPQNPVPSVDHFKQSHGADSCGTRLSNAHSNPPMNTTFPISSHHSNINRLGNDPPNQQTSLPSNPIQQPVHDQSHFQSFSNPYLPNQYAVPYQTRHTLPVSKWNIAKYSGDDQGLKLNEFLEHVQALSQAERVSERELFESAVHLFTGSALKWYMSQRSTGRLMNWQHLVFELRRTYMHPDLDALIKMKIYQRRQQKYESFHEFYFEMEKLFRTMSCQIPDFEKMQILQQNMRVDYKRQMTFLPIADLETLVAAGQKLDALNFSAYNKVFGTDKTVQAIGNKDSGGKKKQKSNISQSDPQVSGQIASVGQPGQFNPNRGNRSQQRPTPNQDTKQFPPNHSRPEPQSSQARNPPKEAAPSNSPMPGPSGTQPRPTLTLDDVVNNHTPPPNNTCFNCGRFGHHTVMCRQPRGTFCSTCGLRGFPTDFCPFCIKNGSSANENRRPQGPQA